jgi:AcrR family transcriptional regulator
LTCRVKHPKFLNLQSILEDSFINEPAQRGRPKQAPKSAKQKEKKIIEAAKKRFKEDGFASVSMRKIAADVGMGAMTLYKYFDSKNEILHHIWEEFFVELFQEQRMRIDAAETATDKYRAACHAYLDYWFNHPDRFRMVFLNEDRASHDSQFFVNHADMESRMNEVFLPLTKQVFPEMDAEQCLVSMQSIACQLHGIALNVVTISEHEWSKPSALLDYYLDSLLRD